MLCLHKSLKAWNTDEFKTVFKNEVQLIPLQELPLQEALKYGSCASMDNFQVMINNSFNEQNRIIVECGLFFSSITQGCSCSDDPSPPDLNNEYGEFMFSIDKPSAETTVTLI